MGISQTQSYKKVERLILRIIQSESFENAILESRRILEIPKDGIGMSESDVLNIAMPMYVPTALQDRRKEPDAKIESAIWSIEEKYLNDLPLNSVFLSLIVRAYLLYNRIFISEIWKHFSKRLPTGICDVRDDHQTLGSFIDHDNFMEHMQAVGDENANLTNRVYIMTQWAIFKQFPMSIAIHPDASQRDIIDFIKQNWDAIQHLQDKYRDQEKSIRNTKINNHPEIEKRNQIILKNRNLPAKQIRKLLAEKGYYLDDGHILKIKSLSKPEK